MKKIVTIGGGTGQFTILEGLKKYDVDLSAVVNVVDSGGSSGKLRVDFGVLPPGDIRNCLIALTDDSKMKDLADLFAYRFKPNSENGLDHNLGNLILTALSKKHGDIAHAAEVAGNLLNIKGRVLPSSINSAHLFAETEKGEILIGEDNISCISKDQGIKKVWLEPAAFIYDKVGEVIKEADLIVICSGELYGSIIPHFLTKGLKEAVKESSAKLVYVCNLVTKQGSYGYKASDFVSEIEKYVDKKLDYVICNTRPPTSKVVDKYIEEESFFVTPDLQGESIIKEELLVEKESGSKVVARHDSEKIAKTIMSILK